MQATFTQPKKDSFNAKYRKNSLSHSFQAVTIEGGELRTLLDLRIYFPNQVCYAALWAPCNDWVNGTGKAGGGGYHKQSAAVSAAFTAAGYSFTEHWGGSGDEAIKDAIRAVCALHGFESVHIIEAHP